MKLLVLSDTHGRKNRIRDVLGMHPRYDALLFLGDGLRDLDALDELPPGLCAVRGNCDGFCLVGTGGDTPTERMLCLDGFKIFMTHGHEYSVKSGRERLLAHAAELDADIVVYGHTHVAEEKYYPEGSELGGITLKKGVYLFNPGSLGEPRGAAPTYGLIQTQNGSVLLSHGTV